MDNFESPRFVNDNNYRRWWRIKLRLESSLPPSSPSLLTQRFEKNREIYFFSRAIVGMWNNISSLSLSPLSLTEEFIP